MDGRMLPRKGSPAAGRNPQSAAFAAARLVAGDLRDVGRDVVRVASLEEARRHPLLTGPSDPDRAQHATLRDLSDLVQVGAGDTAGIDRVEVVAARARPPEERLAVLLLRGEAGLLEVADPALVLAARRDHHRGHGDPQPDVQEWDQDAKEAPAAGQIGLPG